MLTDEPRTALVAEFERARDAYAGLHTVEGEDLADWYARMADAKAEYLAAALDLARDVRRNGDLLTESHRYSLHKGALAIAPHFPARRYWRDTHAA